MPPFRLVASDYKHVNTTIKKPAEIACFSYDENRNLLPLSEHSLRYYYPPFFQLPHATRHQISLSQGFETFRARQDADEGLNGLLDTLIEVEKKSGVKTVADVITWRGVMTKILTAVYEKENGIEFSATTFDGTIFIEEHFESKMEAKERFQAQYTNRQIPQEMAEFWGYKFETLSTLEKPWAECTREEIESRPDKIVDNFAQYCSIVRTRIGSTHLILAGEVDAVLGCKPDDPEQRSRYVELKTSRRPNPKSKRDLEVYDRKLLKFWAQSYLLDVPKIVVGYRDGGGRLNEIDEIDTLNIPTMVKRCGIPQWEGNVCVSAAAAFLDFLKEVCVGEGVWRIKRGAAGDNGVDPEIRVYRTQERGTGLMIPWSFKHWRKELNERASASTTVSEPASAS